MTSVNFVIETPYFHPSWYIIGDSLEDLGAPKIPSPSVYYRIIGPNSISSIF